MGVFNKTPYTNFHELNLNWVIKKIKEVAADNAFFKQFFKTIEDEHILGVVTKVTENNDNTVKTDYLNEDTQQMDNYTVYNKTGTDGAISGAVTPVANRVTTAEGDISFLKTAVNLKVAKNISIASGSSIREFITNTNNRSGAYIVNIQNASDNPLGTGNIATAIIYKHTDNGPYCDILAWNYNGIYIANINSTLPESIPWNAVPRIQVFQGSVTTDNSGYVNINEALGINQMRYMYLSCEIIHTNYYAVKTGTGSLYAANYIRVYNANNQVAQNVTFDIYVAVIPYTK